MADKIQLEGMVFYGFHGVGPEEQKVGQRFVVDLETERGGNTCCCLGAGPSGVELTDTVNYSKMFRVVKDIVEGPSRKLLESVAETIARAILDGFDVESVKVTVKKPEVPIKASILSHAAVEIYRERTNEGR